MTRRCWTCDKTVTDFAANACQRKWCTAKRDVEKELKNGSLPASAVADYTGGYVVGSVGIPVYKVGQ